MSLELKKALVIAKVVEPFTRFFEIELRVVESSDSEEYLAARNDYLLENYVRSPYEQAPGKALDLFMGQIERGGWIKGGEDKPAFRDAAWAVGMELLTDRPSFEVDISNVDVTRGITYATYPEIELQLDLYLPKSRRVDPTPCIICIHGGGWRVHRRPWFGAHAAYFATKGLAAIAIDYRKLPTVKTLIPCIQDTKAAVRWVRANADEFDLDPDRIGAIGGSAGAHLSAMLATTAGIAELEGEGGNAEFSSEIHAAACYAAPVFNPEHAKEPLPSWVPKENGMLISPYAHVSAGSAPIYLLHGTDDQVVPIRNAHEMHEKYQSVGAHSETKILEGAKHVFYTNPEAAGWALDFFCRQFGVE